MVPLDQTYYFHLVLYLHLHPDNQHHKTFALLSLNPFLILSIFLVYFHLYVIMNPYFLLIYLSLDVLIYLIHQIATDILVFLSVLLHFLLYHLNYLYCLRYPLILYISLKFYRSIKFLLLIYFLT